MTSTNLRGSKVPGWEDGEFGHKLGELITTIVDIIKSTIDDAKEARSQFTQDVVSNLNDQNPHFNYIICHVDHDKFFDGNQYEDWGHRHEELDGFFGTSTGFEVYWFRSGSFHRKGDGGYLNWAYIGNLQEKSDNGRMLRFGECL